MEKKSTQYMKIKNVVNFLFLVFLISTAFLIFSFYYFSRAPRIMPDFLSSETEKRFLLETGFQGKIGEISLDAIQKQVFLKDTKIFNSQKQEFLTVKKISLEKVDPISFYKVISQKESFEALYLENLELDFNAWQTDKKKFEIFLSQKSNRFLPKRVHVENLRIKTQFGYIEIPSISISNFSQADLIVVASIKESPLGGKAFLSAQINKNNDSLILTFNLEKFSLSKISELFSPLLPISNSLKFFLTITKIEGTFNLEGKWGTTFGNFLNFWIDPSDPDLYKNLSFKSSIPTGEIKFFNIAIPFSVDSSKENDEFKIDINATQASQQDIGILFKVILKKTPSFSGKLRLNHFSFNSDYFPMIGISAPFMFSGILDLLANFAFQKPIQNTDGQIEIKQITNPFLDLSKVEIGWEHSNNDATFSYNIFVASTSFGGQAKLDLTDWKSPRFKVSGSFRDFPLFLFEKLFPKKKIDGKATGKFDFSGKLDDLSNVFYNSEIEVENLNLEGFSVKKIGTQITGRGKNWILFNPWLKFVNDGIISIKGKVCENSIGGWLVASNIHPNDLHIKSILSEGLISFNGEIKGNPKNPFLSGELLAKDVNLFNASFTKVSTFVDYKNSLLTLNNFRALGESGNLEADVAFHLKKNRFKKAQIKFSDVALDKISSLDEKFSFFKDLHGNFSGEFSHLEEQKNPLWQFKINSRIFQIASNTIENFQLEGAKIGDLIELHSGEAGFGGGKISFNGRFAGKNDSVFLELKSTPIEISEIPFLKNYSNLITGKILIDGFIDYSPQKKNGIITLFGENLTYSKADLGNFGIEVECSNNGIKIKNAAFDKIGINFKGEVALTKPLSYKFSANLKNSDLSFIIGGLNKFLLPIELLVNAEIQGEGNFGNKFPDKLNASIERLQVKNLKSQIINEKNIEIKLEKNQISISPTKFSFENGKICLQGESNLAKNYDFQLSLNKISLKKLKEFFGFPTNFEVPDGEIFLSSNISGETTNPKVEGKIEIKNFKFSGKQIEQVIGNFLIENRELKLQKLELIFPNNRIILSGKTSFDEALSPKELDLKIEIPRGPIDDIPLLFPEYFKSVKGKAFGEISLTGNAFTPTISGDLNLEADEVIFQGMNKPLKNVVMGLKTKEKKVFISPAKAKLGKGNLFGQGEIDFSKEGGQIKIDLTGDQIDLNLSGMDLEKSNTHIAITGDFYNPIIEGSVFLPKGRVQLSDNFFKTTELGKIVTPFKSLKYQIKFEAPRNFWVRNSLLNAEMRGDFKVFGDLKDFHLSGGVQTVQGTIFFQNKKFSIESGEIKFIEHEGKPDANIYFKSTTTIQNIQVYLMLEGKVSTLKPSVYSSPPLMEADILNLLAFGTNPRAGERPAQSGALEKEILESLKNAYLTSLVSSTITKAFNLDEMYFGSLFDQSTGITRSFLRIGKYIGYNIFLAYEGTLSNNQDIKTFIIEYRLPKGFYINFEAEKPTNRNKLGIFYNWKF
ncbi:MAG: translocation/assembly module TamB domain-containing protein [Candidatus Riflebacteria bacterium]|nr:translocation/assembly module TamB domain-containing protein [Candidatus Riflebacteria bacterium]